MCYTRKLRDYVRELIPDIKIVHVKVDIEVLIPKSRIRSDRAMAAMGMTAKDMWEKFIPPADKEMFGQEYSEEALDKYFRHRYYRGLEDTHADEPNSLVIHNNDYDKSSITKLREFVGLPGDFEYDVAKIEAV